MKKYIQTIGDIQKVYAQGKITSFEKLGAFEDGKKVGYGGGSSFLSDNSKAEEETLASLQQQWWLSKLTRKQQRVVIIMTEETKRRHVAVRLGVSLQAVNQIILRIRQRIEIHQAIME